MATITQASKECVSRPADERFPSLTAMREAAGRERALSTVQYTTLRGLGVSAVANEKGGQDVRIEVGGTPVAPTSHAFEQVCRLVGAPPSYISTLPAPLAVDCLREGIDEQVRTGNGRDYAALLTNKDGGVQMRALTSANYPKARIWDEEAIRVAEDIGGAWRLPPARPFGGGPTRVATEADVLDANSDFGLSVKVGDLIADAGAYRGDRDFFLFMVNPERNFDDGAGNAISRSFMFWGSEVGARSIGFRASAFKHVCGNHILWEAQDVLNIRRVHRGVNVRSVFEEIKAFLAVYTDSSTDRETIRIAAARAKMVANTKEEVIERVAGVVYSNKKLATEAFALAEEYYDVHKSDPKSFWGMVEGLTYLSQREANADRRVAIDGIGGKLLAMVK